MRGSTPRRVQDGGVLEVSDARFEELVADGLDALPDEIARLMDNATEVKTSEFADAIISSI